MVISASSDFCYAALRTTTAIIILFFVNECLNNLWPLVQTDSFSTPPRPVQKPFRCCIADIFKGKHMFCFVIYITVFNFLGCPVPLSAGFGTGTCLTGRIESGHVQVGESVLLLPANEITNIKCISPC